MSKYIYECRQDGKQWERLSVSTKSPMPQHELAMYVEQYAQARQCNVDTVSIRVVDEAHNVVDVRLSSAIENMPK